MSAPSRGSSAKAATWAAVGERLWGRSTNRVALMFLAGLVVVAFSADFLASDKPIYLVMGGRTWLLPNLLDPPELRVWNNQQLVARLGRGDWGVFPLCLWGYNTHDLAHVFEAPSGTHWLGTDSAGRDVLARLIHGTRISLSVGVASTAVIVALGTLLGAVAGYFGGWLDGVVGRVIEILNSLPTLLVLIALLGVSPTRGNMAVLTVMLVIGLLHWTSLARLVRGEILRIRDLDYVQAARAHGASDFRILRDHVIPNALGPVLVTAPFAMAGAILVEGTLSFLGFGIPPDLASWGGLLNDVESDPRAWWIAVYPGLVLFLTITAFNHAGEALRDAVDPRLGP